MHMAKLADPSKQDYNMKALMSEMRENLRYRKKKEMDELIQEL